MNELTLPVKALLSAAKTASKSIHKEKFGQKNMLELCRLHLLTKDGVTRVIGTNYQLWTEVVLPQDVNNGDSSYSFVPSTLVDLLTVCGDKTVNITQSEDNIHVVSGGFSVLLTVTDPVPLPKEYDSGESVEVAMDGDVLLDILKTTSYCSTKKDSNRITLETVAFKFSHGSLHAAATDTHRLSKRTAIVDTQLDETLLLPILAVKQITPHLAKSAAIIRWNKQYGQVQIERSGAPGVTITFKIIEGTYPNYEKIIPQVSPLIVRVDRLALLGAMKRAGIMRHHSNGRVMMTFGPALALSTDCSYGKSDEMLPYETLEEPGGAPLFKTAVNYQYAIDALSHITGEFVRWRFGNPLRAFAITGDTDSIDDVAILMPMQVID